MQATRQQILDHLHRAGRATVKELGELLGLTSTGIRQHLTVLERDGLIDSHEERGRVGRPALVYALTEKGEAFFPKAYDQLALLLIEEVRRANGGEALQNVLHRVSARLAEPHLGRLEGRPLEERTREVAAIMQDQGCLVEFESIAEGFLIREYACPFDAVARRNSAVCVLHVDFVSRLTGGDVRLTNSLLRRDRCCTYRVRPREAAARSPSP